MRGGRGVETKPVDRLLVTSVAIAADQVKRLDRLAGRLRESRSTLVRQMLDVELARREAAAR
jgi:predicted transcriptional regulator